MRLIIRRKPEVTTAIAAQSQARGFVKSLARAEDLPAIEFAYNIVPCRTNPLGVKGAGEAGAIGAPPALVNAVVDALGELGIAHLDMPLTPERVWQAIHAAEQRKAA